MWYLDIETRVKHLTERVQPIEVKRLQLDELIDVAKRLESYCDSCERCEYLKKDVDEALRVIETTDTITSTQRRAYNTKMKSVVDHLKKVHHLRTKHHYSTQYSNLGLVASILVGVWFIDQLLIMIFILSLGPFIGKIIGAFKDQKDKDGII